MVQVVPPDCFAPAFCDFLAGGVVGLPWDVDATRATFELANHDANYHTKYFYNYKNAQRIQRHDWNEYTLSTRLFVCVSDSGKSHRLDSKNSSTSRLIWQPKSRPHFNTASRHAPYQYRNRLNDRWESWRQSRSE
jgi:hypothetical protein